MFSSVFHTVKQGTAWVARCALNAGYRIVVGGCILAKGAWEITKPWELEAARKQALQDFEKYFTQLEKRLLEERVAVEQAESLDRVQLDEIQERLQILSEQQTEFAALEQEWRIDLDRQQIESAEDVSRRDVLNTELNEYADICVSYLAGLSENLQELHLSEYTESMVKFSEEVKQAQITTAVDIDLMLDEIRPENVEAAFQRVTEYGGSRESQKIREAAHIYRLLLQSGSVNDEQRNQAKLFLIGVLREAIDKAITSQASTRKDAHIKLEPEVYKLYSLLKSSSVGDALTDEGLACLPAAKEVKIGDFSGLQAVKGEYDEEIKLPKNKDGNLFQKWFAKYSTVQARKGQVDEGVKGFLKKKECSAEDLREITCCLIYSILNKDIQCDFSKIKQKIDTLQSSDQAIVDAKHSFDSMYKIYTYKKELEKIQDLAKSDVKKTKENPINDALNRCQAGTSQGVTDDKLLTIFHGVKNAYYLTQRPYIQHKLEFEIDSTKLQDAKIVLESTPPLTKTFDEQIIDRGWKLSAIIKLVRDRGELPQAFLDKFDDGGLCLLKSYVYPGLVGIGDPMLASAQDLLSLLPDGTDPKLQVQFLRNVIKFMHVNLGGMAIRRTQIAMLKEMAKVAHKNKPTYIIGVAGAGKSTMARFFAECMLSDVPAILFISPVRESRDGVIQVQSLKDLMQQIQSMSQVNQTLKFAITPDKFHEFFKELDAVDDETKKQYVDILQKVVHVCDEFDSEHYVVENLSIQDKFLQHGISRVINMSATDNLVALQVKLERKLLKFHEILHKQGVSIWTLRDENKIKEEINKISGDVARKKAEKLLKRIDELHKAIEEIEKNVKKELNTPQTIIHFSVDKVKIMDPNPSAGQSVLILYPDKKYEDIASLVKQYAQDDVAVLYRNADGKRTVRWNNADSSLEEFSKSSPGQSSVVYCLYTVDSRGGDFDEFSHNDDKKSRVVQRHLFLDSLKSLKELYQNYRRFRSLQNDERNVPVTIYLSEKVREELKTALSSVRGIDDEILKQWQELLNLSNPDLNGKDVLPILLKVATWKDEQEDTSRTMTWLREKIASKTKKVLRQALEDQWQGKFSKSEGLQAYSESYDKAVSSVMVHFQPDLSRTLDQYKELQYKVLCVFAELVGKERIASSAEIAAMEKKKQVITGASRQAIWNARGKATTWKGMWVNYVKSVLKDQGIKDSDAMNYGQGLIRVTEEQLGKGPVPSKLGTQGGTQYPSGMDSVFRDCVQVVRQLDKNIETEKEKQAKHEAIERMKQDWKNKQDSTSLLPKSTLRSLEYKNLEYYQQKLNSLRQEQEITTKQPESPNSSSDAGYTDSSRVSTPQLPG